MERQIVEFLAEKNVFDVNNQFSRDGSEGRPQGGPGGAESAVPDGTPAEPDPALDALSCRWCATGANGPS